MTNSTKVLVLTVKRGVIGGIEYATKDIFDEVSRANFQLVYFDYGQKKNKEALLIKPLRGFYDLIKLTIIIRKTKPQLVHINSSFDRKGILRDTLTILMIRLFHIPVIMWFHGGDIGFIQHSAVYGLFARYIVSRCGTLFVMSQEERKQYIKYFPKRQRSKWIIIKPGINTRKYNSPIQTPKSEGKFIVSFISRVIIEKGVIDLIKGFSLLLKKHNIPAHLYIVGTGSSIRMSKKLTNNLGISKHVTFTGVLPEHRARIYYQQSSVVVLPTYFPEGFPMTILWSLVYGKPIITTRTRGNSDYLREPANCLWVKQKNPIHIAQKLAYLYNNTKLQGAMSTNNLRLSRAFGAKIISRDLMMAYREHL